MGKEEIKLFLFADDMILTSKTLNVPQNILDLINAFGSVSRYENTIQNQYLFCIPK
jgi:hypothetical protein